MRELWAHRRDLAGWSWRLEELACGSYGVTNFETKTVTLDPRMEWGAWRSTVLHEMLHQLRGPALECQRAEEERLVEEMTALTLISLDDLRAVQHMRTIREQARALHVDRKLLKTRLDCLTAAERALLNLS